MTTPEARKAREAWNRCDVCGRFIPLDAFVDGKAVHKLLEPDSDLGSEKFETLCEVHRND